MEILDSFLTGLPSSVGRDSASKDAPLLPGPEQAELVVALDSSNIAISSWSEEDEGTSPADSNVLLLLFTAEVARNASKSDPPTLMMIVLLM